MDAVIERPGDWPQWVRACEKQPVDWDALLGGFAAITDTPGCDFYDALAEYYADARVVLTVRNAEQWFESTQVTVLSDTLGRHFAAGPPELDEMMHKLGWHPADARNRDRRAMLARFDAHVAAVKRTIPPGRLLVFEVREGWGPLCSFLGLPVPDGPFPHVNSSAEFLDMLAAIEASGAEGSSR